MSTSKKKILANRRNSKKSTGPVSNEGKLKSSLNSIKHGLYGDKIAVIGENVDDINDIIDRLVKELKPIGIQQELIVSKMIDIAIRFKRFKGFKKFKRMKSIIKEKRIKIAGKSRWSSEVVYLECFEIS